jgi:hypothetical protein
MADQLPLIERLWAVLLSSNSSDTERLTALHAIDRHLIDAGIDGYEIIERVKTPPVSEEEMQKVFDAGRELGRIENAVMVVPKQPFFSPPFGAPGVSRSSSVYGFEDGDRISGNDIHKNYRWSDIAEHCDDNADRIPDKHHGFLADMVDKLASSYGTVSGKQAKYLASLFTQYLGGRI